MRTSPTAGVVALDHQHRVLLVQRTDGSWALPGGHLQPGETWKGCAEREFYEETGLRVEITGVLGVYSDPASQVHRGLDGELAQLVGVVFEGIVAGAPDREADEEIVAVRYFEPHDLPKSLFPPDRPVLNDAFSEAPRPVIA